MKVILMGLSGLIIILISSCSTQKIIAKNCEEIINQDDFYVYEKIE